MFVTFAFFYTTMRVFCMSVFKMSCCCWITVYLLLWTNSFIVHVTVDHGFLGIWMWTWMKYITIWSHSQAYTTLQVVSVHFYFLHQEEILPQECHWSEYMSLLLFLFHLTLLFQVQKLCSSVRGSIFIKCGLGRLWKGAVFLIGPTIHTYSIRDWRET